MDADRSDAEGLEGLAKEARVRGTVAELGVADFVYDPLFVLRGRARKEVSDGLLICGDQGAILQVKSRASSAADADTSESAARWAGHGVSSRVQWIRLDGLGGN